MHRSPRPWIALGLALAGTIGVGSHIDARSNATITASFADSCRDFAAHASKDISHVVIHYDDGRVVKDETVDSPDFALDGAAGDEIDSAVVKAAQSVEAFECQPAGSPPVALLETPLRCVFGVCTEFAPTDSDGSHERCSDARDTIPFRGTGSSDADDDIASWSIDFGDGSPPASGDWEPAPPAEIRHDFPFPGGLFTLSLTVTDATGLTSTDTIVVCLVDFTPD